MVRLCKPDGLILLLERGASYISLYNAWLQFKAPRDLTERGLVEHLDYEKMIPELFPGKKIVHKERKNMGMTYIYIIANKEEQEKIDEKQVDLSKTNSEAVEK